MVTSTNDPTIVTDRYTSPMNPPRVIDHQGAGWTAVPTGNLLSQERGLLIEGEEPFASDYTVALTRREGNSIDYRRRLTIDGAFELASQLGAAATSADRARAQDNRPEHSDMVSGPMAGSTLADQLDRLPVDVRNNMERKVEFDTSPETARLVLGTDEAPPQNGRPTTVGEAWAAKQQTSPVEDYRTAGSSPTWSRPEDDDTVPALGQLIVLAESFMTRPGHSGSITLARAADGEWVASITYSREGGDGGAGLGTAEIAADALRTALNEVGEQS